MISYLGFAKHATTLEKFVPMADTIHKVGEGMYELMPYIHVLMFYFYVLMFFARRASRSSPRGAFLTMSSGREGCGNAGACGVIARVRTLYVKRVSRVVSGKKTWAAAAEGDASRTPAASTGRPRRLRSSLSRLLRPTPVSK